MNTQLTNRAFLAGCALAAALATAPQAGAADQERAEHFVDEQSVSWKQNEFGISRWKTLIGGNEGGQLDDADVQFGLFTLAPNATYHGHRHDAPEIYYILSGEGRWTVGKETRDVAPGMTILTPPQTVHKMVNLTDEPLTAAWFWWAPGGNRAVFSGKYEFTEPAPVQPANARFADEGAIRVY